MNIKTIPLLVAVILTASYFPAHAMEQEEYTLDMKNGSFDPPALEVPAHQKIHLNVKNDEASQTEFESYSLNQEQKIESGKTTDMYIGPLEPGEYPVFDDNNPDAKGSIVAK